MIKYLTVCFLALIASCSTPMTGEQKITWERWLGKANIVAQEVAAGAKSDDTKAIAAQATELITAVQDAINTGDMDALKLILDQVERYGVPALMDALKKDGMSDDGVLAMRVSIRLLLDELKYLIENQTPPSA